MLNTCRFCTLAASGSDRSALAISIVGSPWSAFARQRPFACGVLLGLSFLHTPANSGMISLLSPMSNFPKSIIFMDFTICLVLLCILRILKRFYLEVIREKSPAEKSKNTIIVGAGNTGEMILRDMARKGFSEFRPVAILDDDDAKLGTYIHGIEVVGGLPKLADAITRRRAQAVIIAIPTLDRRTLRRLFDDAKASKVGLIQAADRGTLFLDEIGCLPLAFQAKILKAIEEKTVRPVGGRAERRVDVQIVAATNGDLAAMVRAGQFRDDLFYRLQVAPLHVPPLRERGDDVLLLAQALLRDICAGYRLPLRTLSPAACAALRAHRWPGNVRELRNTLDRAVLFSDADELGPEALGLPGGAAAPPAGASLRFELPDEGVRFEDVERALLESALRKAGGSQTGAARLLGMSRDTLRYRLEKFGIA